MNFSIYTWGYGVEMYEQLTAIQFFVANPFYFIASALAIGLAVVAFKSLFSQIDEKWAFMGFFLVIGLFITPSNQTFVIEDEATGYAQPISGVPLGIGFALVFESNFEKDLSALARDAYSTPNSIAMESVGIGFSMTASLDAEAAMPSDDFLVQTFDHYVNNCVLSALAMGTTTMTTITGSGNLVSDLAVSNSFETLVFDNANPTGVQQSCQDAWGNISARIDVESNTYIQNELSPLLGLPVNRVNDGLAGTANLLYGVSASGKSLIQQKMTKNLLNNGLTAVGQIVGGDAATAALLAAQTEQQTKGAWIGSGMQAEKTLPMIRIIGTDLLLGSIPILAWIAIATVSFRMVTFIVIGFMTLATWQPLATIINYQFYSRLEKVLQPISNGVLSPIHSSGQVSDVVQNYLANLMWWYSAIPMFSYTLLTLGGTTAMYMLRDASSASTGATTGTNLGGGKVDFGNTKVGDNSQNNDRVGTGTYVGADGVTTTTNSNGGTETQNVGTASDGTAYKTSTLNTASGTAMSVDTGGAGIVGLDGSGHIRSMSGQNWGAGVDSAQQFSHAQALGNEATAQTQFAQAIGKTITDGMRNGSSITDSSSLSRTLGLDSAKSSTLSSVASESVGKAFTSTFNQSEQQEILKRAGATLGMGASAEVTAGTPAEGLFGSGASASIGANGRVEISGTRADGSSYAASLNAEESSRYMEQYEKTLSQSLTEKEGLALDIAKNMSITSGSEHAELKNAQDTYSQAHSIAAHSSETFNRVNQFAQSNNVDLAPEILNKFIQNDPKLSAQWGMHGSDHARIAADAAIRIQNSQLDPNNNVVDSNNFKQSVNAVYSDFAKANGLIDTINNRIDNGQVNAESIINQGRDGIDSFSVDAVATTLDSQIGSYHSQASGLKGNASHSASEFSAKHGLGVHTTVDTNSGELSNLVIDRQHDSLGQTIKNAVYNPPTSKEEIQDIVETAIQQTTPTKTITPSNQKTKIEEK